jgi:hypothetical protein
MITYKAAAMLRRIGELLIKIGKLEQRVNLWRWQYEKAVKLLATAHERIISYAKTETDVDNALVGIKNVLWAQINEQDENQLWFVVRYLAVSVNLWEKLGYAYKGTELLSAVALEMKIILENLPHQSHRRIKQLEQRLRSVSNLQDKYIQAQARYMTR